MNTIDEVLARYGTAPNAPEDAGPPTLAQYIKRLARFQATRRLLKADAGSHGLQEEFEASLTEAELAEFRHLLARLNDDLFPQGGA